MKITDKDLQLYAITDTRWLKTCTMEQQVEQALKGGITFLQLRYKDATHQERVEMALKIKPIAKKYNVPFVIDDDVLAAVEADVDGVHIGQKDTSYEEARKLLGPDKIIGMTTKTVEQALHAQTLGADYIGTGAIFNTQTKVETIHMTKETLLDIAEHVNIPMVAIGGLNYDNMDYLKNTGVSGIAVISAIFASSDITQAAKKLREKTSSLFNYEARNIIFDLDGTLFDSMPYWSRVAREFAISKGASIPDDFDRVTYTMDLNECGKYLQEDLGINEDTESMKKEVLQIMDNHYKYDIPMKKAMHRLVIREHHNNSKICLFTNSDKECAKNALKRVGLYDCFDMITTSYDIGISKKDPESYKKICKIMGFDVNNTYVYEDVLHSVQSAKAAGCKVIAVYDEDSSKYWDQIKAIADDVIYKI